MALRVKPSIVSNSKKKFEDTRVSVCTDCGWGIFTSHKYSWTNRGLVHDDCYNKGSNEAENST